MLPSRSAPLAPDAVAPARTAKGGMPVCYFVQEMVARLGIATGKGHAAMIYECFGKWWGGASHSSICW
ncbi:MAG: divalent metal cation transporter [Alloacidobacterium sp.]